MGLRAGDAYFNILGTPGKQNRWQLEKYQGARQGWQAVDASTDA